MMVDGCICMGQLHGKGCVVLNPQMRFRVVLKTAWGVELDPCATRFSIGQMVELSDVFKTLQGLGIPMRKKLRSIRMRSVNVGLFCELTMEDERRRKRTTTKVVDFVLSPIFIFIYSTFRNHTFMLSTSFATQFIDQHFCLFTSSQNAASIQIFNAKEKRKVKERMDLMFGCYLV